LASNQKWFYFDINKFLGKHFLNSLGELAPCSPRNIGKFTQSTNWTPL